jgi:hypothetical protein
MRRGASGLARPAAAFRAIWSDARTGDIAANRNRAAAGAAVADAAAALRAGAAGVCGVGTALERAAATLGACPTAPAEEEARRSSPPGRAGGDGGSDHRHMPGSSDRIAGRPSLAPSVRVGSGAARTVVDRPPRAAIVSDVITIPRAPSATIGSFPHLGPLLCWSRLEAYSLRSNSSQATVAFTPRANGNRRLTDRLVVAHTGIESIQERGG